MEGGLFNDGYIYSIEKNNTFLEELENCEFTELKELNVIGMSIGVSNDSNDEKTTDIEYIDLIYVQHIIDNSKGKINVNIYNKNRETAEKQKLFFEEKFSERINCFIHQWNEEGWE